MRFNILLCLLVITLRSSGTRAECVEPPEGLWLLQAYEPPMAFIHPTISGYLTLKRDTNNQEVFIGKAPVYINENFPFKTPFELTGLFDKESCILYGAYCLSEVFIHDTFAWFYDGKKSMYGLYRPIFFGRPNFPQHSLHILQYQGPKESVK